MPRDNHIDWMEFFHADINDVDIYPMGTAHIEYFFNPDRYINDVWKEYRRWARENGLNLEPTYTNIRKFLAYKWQLKYDQADVDVDEGHLLTAVWDDDFSVKLGLRDTWDVLKEDAVSIWQAFGARYQVLKSFDWHAYLMRQLQDMVDEFAKVLTIDPVYLACCLLDTGLTLERYIPPWMLGLFGVILKILSKSKMLHINLSFDLMELLNTSLGFMIRTGWVVFLKFVVFNAVSAVWYKIDNLLYELGMCIVDESRANTSWCKDWMRFLRCVPMMEFLYFIYNKLTGMKDSILSFYFDLLNDIRFREAHFLETLRGALDSAISINFLNRWEDIMGKLMAIVDALALCVSSGDVMDYKQRFKHYSAPRVPPPGVNEESAEHFHTSGASLERSATGHYATTWHGGGDGGVVAGSDISRETMDVRDVVASVIPNELYRRLIEWYNFIQSRVNDGSTECDQSLMTGLYRLLEELYE